MTSPNRPPNSSADDFARYRAILSLADDAARDSAILFSIAIQHGADVEMICEVLAKGRQAARSASWYPNPNETETPPSA